jgi:hypothetical protein
LLRCERRSIRLLTICRGSKEKGSTVFWIFSKVQSCGLN